jgi:hypothetical protein
MQLIYSTIARSLYPDFSQDFRKYGSKTTKIYVAKEFQQLKAFGCGSFKKTGLIWAKSLKVIQCNEHKLQSF